MSDLFRNPSSCLGFPIWAVLSFSPEDGKQKFAAASTKVSWVHILLKKSNFGVIDKLFCHAGRSKIFGEGAGQIPAPALLGKLITSGPQSYLTFEDLEVLPDNRNFQISGFFSKICMKRTLHSLSGDPELTFDEIVANGSRSRLANQPQTGTDSQLGML